MLQSMGLQRVGHDLVTEQLRGKLNNKFLKEEALFVILVLKLFHLLLPFLSES